jgi:DNA-binding response OmpR family regulator
MSDNTQDEPKILIVEDEKPMAKALNLKLNNSGFSAEVAGDGEQALETLEDNQFDILLLDLVMPNLDGFDVLEKLNSEDSPFDRPRTIIILSNLSQESDIEKAKNMGADDFFVKSDISINQIVDEVKQYS